MRYPVKVEKSEGSYVVTLNHPAGRFQGACEAKTRAEALKEMEEVLEAMVASALAAGEDIPAPADCMHGNAYIILPPMLAAKVSLFIEMRKQGKRKADLARALGVNQKQVDRMFSPRHASVLSQFEAAAMALGKTLEIRLA